MFPLSVLPSKMFYSCVLADRQLLQRRTETAERGGAATGRVVLQCSAVEIIGLGSFLRFMLDVFL